MKSPWTKKNPWLSMYLSAANAIAGSVYGWSVAAAKRQAGAAVTTGMEQFAHAWTNALSPPSPKKRKRKRAR